MKLILLRLKLLFHSRSTCYFFKILVISLPVVLGTMYYAISTHERNAKINALSEKIELISEKSTHNDKIIIEHSFLRHSRNLSHEPFRNFWEGTALDPRYSLPEQGKPNPR